MIWSVSELHILVPPSGTGIHKWNPNLVRRKSWCIEMDLKLLYLHRLRQNLRKRMVGSHSRKLLVLPPFRYVLCNCSKYSSNVLKSDGQGLFCHYIDNILEACVHTRGVHAQTIGNFHKKMWSFGVPGTNIKCCIGIIPRHVCGGGYTFGNKRLPGYLHFLFNSMLQVLTFSCEDTLYRQHSDERFFI